MLQRWLTQLLTFLLFGWSLACHPQKAAVTAMSGFSALSAGKRPSNTSCLARIRSAEPFPKTLSESGCVDPALPQNPAAGMIPYEIVAPLWSDGSSKERYLALPDDGILLLTSGGSIEAPVGTVTMKTFRLEDKPIETRLFMHDAEGQWHGYSYEWREDGSDADLVEKGKEKILSHQTWVFPSSKTCDSCHSANAGFVLGLQAAQLNQPLAILGDTSKDQITLWKDLGLLKDTRPRADGVALVDYRDKDQALGVRARSYLQANCAFCHQPGSAVGGSMDLRADTSFANMGLCQSEPQFDTLGLTDPKLYKPGSPEESILYLRMKADDINHMPPLISRVNDPLGINLIKLWIESRSSCL